MLLISKQTVRILEIISLVFFIIGCARPDVFKQTTSSSLGTSQQAQTGEADFSNGKSAYKKGDYATAFKLSHKAAEQGHAGAQLELGLMYIFGQGVSKNNSKAVKWIRKAAEQGYALAQFNLGVLYNEGTGLSQNHQEAVRRFPKKKVPRFQVGRIRISHLGKDSVPASPQFLSSLSESA